MPKITITKNNNSIVLMDSSNAIETYSTTEAVDFSGLMKYLLKLELSEKVDLIIDKSVEYSEDDASITTLINKITDAYNSKVDEFLIFVNGIETKKP